MEEDEIKQFVIRMSNNEDKYKAQAEVLYQKGVTGAALKADYEDGKEAFIKAMKDDYKIMGTAFAKTLYQKLKEKLRRGDFHCSFVTDFISGEKRKSISDYELESDTKGKRFKIDAEAEEFFQALRDIPFTKGTAMQLVRIMKNILVPGHRASWIRGSKHPVTLFYRKAFSEAVRRFRDHYHLYHDGKSNIDCGILSGQSGIAKSVAFLLMYIKVALEKNEKVAFYSVPEKCLYLLEVRSGRVDCKKLKVLDEGWTELPEWVAFDSTSTHLVVDPENGFGHLNVNVINAFVVVASSPNREWNLLSASKPDMLSLCLDCSSASAPTTLDST